MTKFMILSKYGGTEDGVPMSEWAPEDITVHIAFLEALNRELAANGELVDGQALTGPDLAKIVTSDGVKAPVVTDGPFPEYKELLAGYQMIDVDSEARAVEIAARVSAAPGPGGRPLGQRVELRQVMGNLPGVEL